LPREQRFVLRCVDWQTYRTISEALNGRHLRFTYDQGTLEFGSVSSRRASCSHLLGRLIIVLTEELGIPVRGFGDMTCDREDLECGVEPDESFYIGNEPRVRDKEDIDLTTDPPPDLLVEIDISRSSRRRLGIYAALGGPEVWRSDGETLEVYRLHEGRYAVSDSSQHFPQIPVRELAGFLRRRPQVDENSLVKSFREWVRQQISNP
jgi:Uma2 family endonuclease